MFKVLFLARSDLDRIKAGDTIQINCLKSVLEKKGVKVDICLDLRPDPCGYDLVHCFNILRIDNAASQLYSINDRKIPIIITPIYWNMEEYLIKMKPDKIEKWIEKQSLRKEVLKCADLIIPNAHIEWELLKKDFNLNQEYRVIYNGVDMSFYNKIKTKRHGIISVGRIHSRKNQLSLIEAVKGTGISLTFVGDNNERKYYKECLAAANNFSNIRFHRGVEKDTLIKLYRQSKVHVLSSWYDTPGLVNLEAGLSGCNLVTTNRGTAKEYLNDYAYYCDPDNIPQIKEVVSRAYYRVSNNELANHILLNYTWNKVGEDLSKIYSEITGCNI